MVDDGKITLSAVECAKSIIKCLVERAGVLFSHSTITLPNTPLDLPTFSADDQELIKVCIGKFVDFVFVSGIMSKDTLMEVKNRMAQG